MADLKQNTWETDTWYAQRVAGATDTPSASLGLYWWGKNDNGQGGLNSTATGNYSSPVQVGTSGEWDAISSGSYATGWLKDGKLYVTGQNNPPGVLGMNQGPSNTRYSSPTQVGTNDNWASIYFGRSACMAVKTDGTLWTWGDNPQGLLGHNNQNDYSSPRQVGTNTNWSTAVGKIDGGFSRMGAIKTDGTLWGWGNSDYGNLGQNESHVYYSSPVSIGTDTNWSQITGFGGANVSAIKTDGTLWAWGSSNQGTLGLNKQGTPAHVSSPTQVGTNTNWKTIKMGGLASNIAIKTDGTMWGWGDNENGELGLNQGSATADYSSPHQIGTNTNWNQIRGSGRVYHATTTDGSMYAWGKNLNGQTGADNKTPGISSPQQIAGNWDLTNITSVAYNSAYGTAFKV